MKQTITQMGAGTAVELDIDDEEVFSEEFKQYAKLTYLGCIACNYSKNSLSVLGGDPVIGGRKEFDQAEFLNDIGARLCAVTARAVAYTLSEITKELRNPENLNAALKELFGDSWDESQRDFKKKEEEK